MTCASRRQTLVTGEIGRALSQHTADLAFSILKVA